MRHVGDIAIIKTEGVHDICASGTPLDFIPPVGLNSREKGSLNRKVESLDGHLDRIDFMHSLFKMGLA